MPRNRSVFRFSRVSLVWRLHNTQEIQIDWIAGIRLKLSQWYSETRCAWVRLFPAVGPRRFPGLSASYSRPVNDRAYPKLVVRFANYDLHRRCFSLSARRLEIDCGCSRGEGGLKDIEI